MIPAIFFAAIHAKATIAHANVVTVRELKKPNPESAIIPKA